jgi:HEPN domain-containing protein
VLDLKESENVNRASDWLRQAERDLGFAETGAGAGYHEGAAFYAQQSGEKAVKALIQFLHGGVRGHSITDMLRQMPESIEVTPSLLNAAQELDKVYVTSRYPNGFISGTPADYFSSKSSAELLAYARAILDWCRSQIH